MGLISRFRRALGASVEAHRPQTYRARGVDVVCPVCGGQEFVRASGDFYVKPLFLGFNAPWLRLDRQATSLLCTHCTHLLPFGKAPEPAEDGPPSPEIRGR